MQVNTAKISHHPMFFFFFPLLFVGPHVLSHRSLVKIPDGKHDSIFELHSSVVTFAIYLIAFIYFYSIPETLYYFFTYVIENSGQEGRR